MPTVVPLANIVATGYYGQGLLDFRSVACLAPTSTFVHMAIIAGCSTLNSTIFVWRPMASDFIQFGPAILDLKQVNGHTHVLSYVDTVRETHN
jgi:hypothetical protein